MSDNVPVPLEGSEKGTQQDLEKGTQQDLEKGTQQDLEKGTQQDLEKGTQQDLEKVIFPSCFNISSLQWSCIRNLGTSWV